MCVAERHGVKFTADQFGAYESEDVERSTAYLNLVAQFFREQGIIADYEGKIVDVFCDDYLNSLAGPVREAIERWKKALGRA